MTLSFADKWSKHDPLGDWPIPGASAFATSRAYEIFLRELRRYTLEEVGGRSFLIAGQRGAGKTALVREAVRALNTEMLNASINPETNTVSRRGRLQRPLIVNLAAQSLIAPPPQRDGALAEQEGKSDAPTDGAAQKTSQRADGEKSEGIKDAPAAGSAKPTDEKPRDEVASALVHITIALCRALAREVSRGFGIHARGPADRGREDRLELAAQLLLDLDDAPEPSLLRRRWRQLGRLGSGVLWPTLADATLRRNDISDQGLREIIAVATAAQVFQVVSGDVTYKVKSIDTATRDDETKSSVDIMALIGRLGAVFAGTAAGGTALAAGKEHVAMAVGLGLLVWLGSSFALGGTRSDKLRRERSRDYTFLRDRSIQTLDRELPQVIERIREAGLAPIFVLDELDKVPHGTIVSILNRLKHIVADFSFFCFLANRDYYDALERVVEAQPYPSEHTYFSERLFVFNRPTELFAYIADDLIGSDLADQNVENLPKATFALVSIYRSKLNFTDLSRELNRRAKPNLELTFSSQQLRERRDLRLAAALQLAFDEAIRSEPLATRFASDEAFAQLAADALYYVPRQWEADPTKSVDVSPEKLKSYLLERSCGTPGAEKPGTPAKEPPTRRTRGQREGSAAEPVAQTENPKTSEDGVLPSIGPGDFEQALTLVRREIEFLSNWKTLADALRDHPGAKPWRLDEIVPGEIGVPFMEAVPGYPNSYRFLLDESGGIRPAEVALPTEISAGEARDLVAAFTDLLEDAGLTLDGLVRAGYMPATVTSETLFNAERALTAADETSEQVDRARNTVTLLRQSLADRSRMLSLALIAYEDFRTYGRMGRTGDDTLLLLSRYFSPAGRETSANSLSSFARIAKRLDSRDAEHVLTAPTGVAGLVDVLRMRQILAAQATLTESPDLDVPGSWARWQVRFRQWFDEGESIIEDVERVDVITAMRGDPPGIFFRSDLSTITTREWSRVLLAALPDNRGVLKAPIWMCFVAMRAIGFDANLLQRLLGDLPDVPKVEIPPWDRKFIEGVVAKAPVNQSRGILLLAQNDGEPILGASNAQGQPIVVVAASEYPLYDRGLDWLGAAEAFEGVVDES